MYADHQLHGEALDYFENGQLRSSVNFEHGKQSGPFKLFSDDGQLLEEGRECQDFCVWGGYSRGSPTRLPFVFCDAVCQT